MTTHLTTDIEQTVCQLADTEGRLGDTRGLDTRAQDILVGREIPRRAHPVDAVEIVRRAVVELVLARAADGFADGRVAPEVVPVSAWTIRGSQAKHSPQPANRIDDFPRQGVAFDLAGETHDGLTACVVSLSECEVELGHRIEDSTVDGIAQTAKDRQMCQSKDSVAAMWRGQVAGVQERAECRQ